MDPTLTPGAPPPRYEKAMQDLLERMWLSPISGGKDFRQILLERLDKFRIQIPPELPNWGADVDFDDAGKIALDDGIPWPTSRPPRSSPRSSPHPRRRTAAKCSSTRRRPSPTPAG